LVCLSSEVGGGAVVVARSKMALAGGSLRRLLHGWLVNVDDMVWDLVVFSSMSYEQNIRFCDVQGCD